MNKQKENIVLLSALIVWFILAVIGILHHELWRDEFQAILLVRESSSISDLFHNTRYEGHGGLWFVFLYLIKQINNSFLAVQIAHLAIAFVSVYLLLFKSPLPLATRILSVFGYFFLFEYAVISRNYAFAVLMVLLFAWSFTSLSKYKVPVRIVAIAMLGMTGVYGLISAFVLFLYSLFHGIRKDNIVLTIVFISVALLMAIEMQPPADGGFAADWFLKLDIKKAAHAVEIVFEGMVPVPKPGLHFWDTNILDGNPLLTAVKIILAGIILSWSYYLFRDRYLFLLFLATSFAIVLFTYVKYDSLVRHAGHIYLVFLACAWISKLPDRKNAYLLNLLLLIHIAAGVYSYAGDFRNPFTGAKDASIFLQNNSKAEDMISADTDFIGTPVAGYLGRKMFYPQSDRWGTYMIFDQKRAELVNFDTVYARSLRKASPGQEIIFLLDYPADTISYPVRLVYKGPEAIVENEHYLVYRIIKP